MTSPLKITVAGARGQMGQALIAVMKADPAVNFVGGFGRPGNDAGAGAGDLLIDIEQALSIADVVVDFTTGAASAALAERCAAQAGPRGSAPALVIGSTGFESAELTRIAAAATRVAILRSGNFSLGVNMLMGLVAQAARSLPAEAWDIEIVEAHHRRKIDAPSGTALMLGAAAAEGRSVPLAAVERRGRDGLTGPRAVGEIGFSVLRGGGIVGEHSVVFAAEAETLTLSHAALDRSMFARGAIAAAHWLADRAPGEYNMQHVLGFAG